MVSPPSPPSPKPLADGIPTDQAWRVGRRVYIRCGYNSTLNQALRALHATWDADTRALWVGSGKAAQVIPLVQDHLTRLTEVADLKRNGLRLTIPFEATEIRARVKAAPGTAYDGDTKTWLVASRELHDQLKTEVESFLAAAAARRTAENEALAAAATQRRDTQRAAGEAEAVRLAGVADQAVIDRSGRTTTGETGIQNGRLNGRMRRPDADRAKPQPGEVIRLTDGRRALILASTANFFSQDNIDDGFSPDLSDQPGWYYRSRWVEVEPTPQEAADDATQRVDAAAEAAARAVLDTATHLTPTRGEWTCPVEGAATITLDPPGHLSIHGGRVIRTPDGCWFQHPGWYDDWRAWETDITDPQLVARVDAVLAGGSHQWWGLVVAVPDAH